MDQCDMVLARLNRGPVTARMAAEELGVMRLAARIHDLKVRGESIEADMVEVPTRYGTTAWVARYRLRVAGELFPCQG